MVLNVLMRQPIAAHLRCSNIVIVACLLLVISQCVMSGCESLHKTGIKASNAVVLWGRSGDVGFIELHSSEYGSLDKQQLPGIAVSLTDISRRSSGLKQFCAISDPMPFKWASILSLYQVQNDSIIKSSEIEVTPRVSFVYANDFGFALTQRNKVSELDLSTHRIKELATVADDVVLNVFLIDEHNIYCTGWYPPVDRDEKYYLYSFSRNGESLRNYGSISKQRVNNRLGLVDITLHDDTTVSFHLPQRSDEDTRLVQPDYSLSSKPSTTFFSYGTHRETRRAMFPLGIVVFPTTEVNPR